MDAYISNTYFSILMYMSMYYSYGLSIIVHIFMIVQTWGEGESVIEV